MSRTQFQATLAKGRSQMIKAVPEFNQLRQRRYVNPRGYISYEDAIELGCGILLGFRLAPNAQRNFVDFYAAYLTQRIAQEQAPTYWLTSDLQSAILQTDLPAHVVGMKRAIPCGILFLPSAGLISPDGEPFSFVYFAHHLKEEVVSHNLIGEETSEQCEFDCVRWCTVMPSGLTYGGNVGIDQSEGLDLGVHDYSGVRAESVEVSAEDRFIEQCGNLILQTLLLVQSRPDLVEAEQVLGFGGKQQRKHQQPSALLHPRWIGKSYQMKRERSTESSGTHVSPRMHWRCGHYKRVPIGERSKGERKWVWIEPTLVNG